MTKSNKPRILVLDIETGPGKAYFWNTYDDFIPLERVIEPGRMLCFAAKFVGETTVHFGAEWITSRKEMLTRLRNLLNEADAVITYNGDKFDFRKIRGEFVANGIKPAAPITSIDLYKTARGLGYTSGKLDYVSVFLQLGSKKKHEGFGLWRKVLAGDLLAQSRMMRYNIQDIKLTERLYKKLRPYIENHPALHGVHCSVCGAKKLQKRGTRKTRRMIYDRVECQACGHWDKGPLRRIK
jgi:DNA polymerase elongation subunit (family B)